MKEEMYEIGTLVKIKNTNESTVYEIMQIIHDPFDNENKYVLKYIMESGDIRLHTCLWSPKELYKLKREFEIGDKVHLKFETKMDTSIHKIVGKFADENILQYKYVVKSETNQISNALWLFEHLLRAEDKA